MPVVAPPRGERGILTEAESRLEGGRRRSPSWGAWNIEKAETGDQRHGAKVAPPRGERGILNVGSLYAYVRR